MPSTSAVVVPVAPDGTVLVLRRGPTDRWKPGHWNFPGGKVDVGETVEQGAVRELYEEANVQAWQLKPLGHFWAGDRLIFVFMALLPYKPTVQSNDGEHDFFHWGRLGALPQPTIPHLHRVQRAAVAALQEAGLR